MPGTVIRLLEAQTVDWSNVQANWSVPIVARDYIDMSGWTDGQLLARQHAGTTGGRGAVLTIELYALAPARDDPSQFFDPIAAGQSPLAGVALPMTAPYNFTLSTVFRNFGAAGRLRLILTQPATPQTAKVVLSVDLILK